MTTTTYDYGIDLTLISGAGGCANEKPPACATSKYVTKEWDKFGVRQQLLVRSKWTHGGGTVLLLQRSSLTAGSGNVFSGKNCAGIERAISQLRAHYRYRKGNGQQHGTRTVRNWGSRGRQKGSRRGTPLSKRGEEASGNLVGLPCRH